MNTRKNRRIKRLTQLPGFLVLDIKREISARRESGLKSRICIILHYNGTGYIIEETERKIYTIYEMNTEILKAEYTRGYQAPFKTKIIEFKECELWEI